MGAFKKADVGSPPSPGIKHAVPLARPQPFGRAERTEAYVSAHDPKRQVCVPKGGQGIRTPVAAIFNTPTIKYGRRLR